MQGVSIAFAVRFESLLGPQRNVAVASAEKTAILWNRNNPKASPAAIVLSGARCRPSAATDHLGVCRVV